MICMTVRRENQYTKLQFDLQGMKKIKIFGNKEKTKRQRHESFKEIKSLHLYNLIRPFTHLRINSIYNFHCYRDKQTRNIQKGKENLRII